MKKLLIPFFFLLSANCFAQVSANDFTGTIDKLFAQEYSKEATEYLTKVYVAKDVLKLKENELTGFEIDAITSAKSGELTTVLYNCPKLNQRGLVLVFWKNRIYNFYHFEYSDAIVLLDKISTAIEDNKEILDQVNTSVLKANDIHFVFAESSIRVIWNQYDSLWDKSNFKTTHKRFDKFFKKQFQK